MNDDNKQLINQIENTVTLLNLLVDDDIIIMHTIGYDHTHADSLVFGLDDEAKNGIKKIMIDSLIGELQKKSMSLKGATK